MNTLLAHIGGHAHVHSGDVTIILIASLICAAALYFINRQERR
jgi:hypothetical protein